MKRKLLVMLTLMLLVVSVVAMNVSADSGYFNYGCSSKTRLGAVYNGTGSNRTFSAKAVPTAGGTTHLELYDYNGAVKYAEGDYPLNPTNPGYTQCPIANGGYVSVYVRPIPNGTYISGKVYWAF